MSRRWAALDAASGRLLHSLLNTVMAVVGDLQDESGVVIHLSGGGVALSGVGVVLSFTTMP